MVLYCAVYIDDRDKKLMQIMYLAMRPYTREANVGVNSDGVDSDSWDCSLTRAITSRGKLLVL